MYFATFIKPWKCTCYKIDFFFLELVWTEKRGFIFIIVLCNEQIWPNTPYFYWNINYLTYLILQSSVSYKLWCFETPRDAIYSGPQKDGNFYWEKYAHARIYANMQIAYNYKNNDSFLVYNMIYMFVLLEIVYVKKT